MEAANISTNKWGKLDERRRELRMSIPALAERSGVSVPTVKRILSGEDNPTVMNLQAIAHALGVEIRLNGPVQVVEQSTPMEFREAAARQKAKWLMSLVQGTSALEGQAVDADSYQEMLEQTVHELMAGSPRKVWAA